MSGRRWIPIVIAVAAVAIAAVIVVVVTGDDGPGIDPTDATALSDEDQDAAWACSIAKKYAEPLTEDELSIEEPPIYLMLAAGALAQAASHETDEWSHLEETGQALFAAASQLDPDELDAALENLGDDCQDAPDVQFPGDVQLTCEIVESLPDNLTADDMSVDGPILWELTAIGSLGLANEARDDPAPDSFAEPAAAVYESARVLDAQQASQGIADLRDFCADHD